MPYVIDEEKDKRFKNLADDGSVTPATQMSSTSGGYSLGPDLTKAATSPEASTAAGPTDFVNFDRYVNANQGGMDKMTDSSVGYAENKMKDAQGALQQAEGNFNRDLNTNYNHLKEVKDPVTAPTTGDVAGVGTTHKVGGFTGALNMDTPDAQDSVVGLSGVGKSKSGGFTGAVGMADKAAEPVKALNAQPKPVNPATSLMDTFMQPPGAGAKGTQYVQPQQTYTGPNSLLDPKYNLGGITNLYNKGASAGKQGMTEAGRMALLDKQFGQSSAGEGGNALDAALLGYGGQGRFGALQNQYAGFDNLLKGAVARTGGQVANARNEIAQHNAANAVPQGGGYNPTPDQAGHTGPSQSWADWDKAHGAGGTLADVVDVADMGANGIINGANAIFGPGTIQHPPTPGSTVGQLTGHQGGAGVGPTAMTEELYNHLTDDELDTYQKMDPIARAQFVVRKKKELGIK